MQTSSSGTGSNLQPWMSHITNQSTPKPAADPWVNSLLRYQFAAININNGNVIPSTMIPPNPYSRRRIQDPTKDIRRNVAIPDSFIKNEITEANLDTLLNIEMPPNEGQSEEKLAIDMVEIKRLKMRKHQKRKWLKKYKYQQAKSRIRKFQREEKELHANILGQIREAEDFSAEQYVEEKLAKLEAPVKRLRKIISIW